MRRTILLAAVVTLALAVAPAASASPPPKGCPAEASVWTEVQYGQPNYSDNSLYTFYFVTNPAAGALFAELNGFDLSTEAGRAAAYALAEQFTAPVDRNQDFTFCISWIGGNPGLADFLVSVVDNHSATPN